MKRQIRTLIKKRNGDPVNIHVFIPFLEGRPKRKKIIRKDDITNLKILLHTCESLLGFAFF